MSWYSSCRYKTDVAYVTLKPRTLIGPQAILKIESNYQMFTFDGEAFAWEENADAYTGQGGESAIKNTKPL